jgi:ABC transport system ATP-binding/permease protein
VIVLGVLSLFQALVFLLLIALRVEFPDLDVQRALRLFANLYLVYLGGMSMGLVISAFVANEDRATGLVPLVVIPQMTLAGAIIPIENMPGIGKYISNVAVSRWAFENFGRITDMNDRLNALVAQRPGLTNEYETAFSQSLRSHYGVLILFVIVLLTIATLLVKRKDVR